MEADLLSLQHVLHGAEHVVERFVRLVELCDLGEVAVSGVVLLVALLVVLHARFENTCSARKAVSRKMSKCARMKIGIKRLVSGNPQILYLCRREVP